MANQNPNLPNPPLNVPIAGKLVDESWGGFFRRLCQMISPIVNPPNIVCLGDSRTYGYPVDRNQAYPAQLGSSIGCSPINLGVNGATTAGYGGTPSVLGAQVPLAVAAFNPQVRNIGCIFPGVNDCGLGLANATIEANYIQIVLKMKNAGYRTMAMTIPTSNYVSAPYVPGYEANVLLVNSWMRTGASGADIVCDVANDPRLANYADTAYFQADELHFTALANSCIAADVRAILGSVLGS